MISYLHYYLLRITLPYRLGLSSYTVWDYPTIPFGITLLYRLGLLSHTVWDYPPILFGITLLYRLGLPSYTVWDYPPILFGIILLYRLGLSSYTVWDDDLTAIGTAETSDNKISSPILHQYDTIIIINDQSMDKFALYAN